MEKRTVKAAVVQAAPKLFDKRDAFEQIEAWTERASGEGVELVVFPEVFVSGYPRGLSFGTRVGSRNEAGRSDWASYMDSAITIPGRDCDVIGKAARENGVYLIVGVVEREGSTLYNTIVYFGPDGTLLGKHRKLVPTGSERILWGQGDGSTLTVIDTPFGRIGGLICWENYMPLARMAMYAKGIDILVTPTADCRDTWQATIRHIACEGRCFVLSSNQYATKSLYPQQLAGYADVAGDDEVLSTGGSAIVGPLGAYAAEPLYGSEGLVVAELDLSQVARSRFDFDVVGHYSRPDIFRLIVDERRRDNVQFWGAEGSLAE